jgi:hypothetical protein
MQRFGREDKKLEAEVEQRTKDVRHEKGDIPTGAGAEAESCREQEKFRNLPLMHNRPHREPQYPGRKECLKRNDDPGLKCAVEDVHDDAVDLRTGLKQSRVTEPEQLAEDGTTVPKVLALVREEKWKLVQKRRPEKHEGSGYDRERALEMAFQRYANRIAFHRHRRPISAGGFPERWLQEEYRESCIHCEGHQILVTQVPLAQKEKTHAPFVKQLPDGAVAGPT